MTEVVAECLKNPKRSSYWSVSDKRYVCPESSHQTQKSDAVQEAAGRPPLHENFKLVFLAVFGGAILFTLICVGCHIATGGQPSDSLQGLIDTLLDMAKFGFGAIVGLIGAKAR